MSFTFDMNAKIFDMMHLFFTLLACILIFFCNEFTLADRSTCIVHMDRSAMPKAFASHHDWYSATIGSLYVTSTIKPDTHGSKPQLLYTYDNALYGFSAVLSLEEVQKLENSSGFVTAYPDKILQLHTTHTSDFLSLNAVSGLWPASNYGKGVIIGLMDTGVWPESKSYNDDGMAEIPTRWKGICQAGDDFNSSMCNRKLIGARYYNDGAKAANLRAATEGGSPRDPNGHGTHTSTIAAGNYAEDVSFFGYAKGTARGIAPRAHVAMYQVSADVGTGSDFIAGMDQAIADGVDVISISQGLGKTPLYEDSMAIAGFAAVEKGVVVSVSAGNSGPNLGMVENGAPWLMTVGASTIDRQNSALLTFGNGNSMTGWSQFPANALLENVVVVYNKTLPACNSPELLSEVSLKIFICSDEYWYFAQQTQAVVNSNVAAAIFITNDTQFMEKERMDCPGVVVNHAQAPELISYVTSTSNPTLSIKFQQVVLGAKPAPAVSFFSSRGPSQTYPTILKPDIIAPGSKVLAAYSPLGISAFIGSNIALSNDYTLMSGTSMSAPHAAGVAALLKSAHPDWSPAAIRSAMMTTASQIGNDGHPIRDNGHHLRYATSLDMGSGHIDPNRALDPGLIYDADAQDYINHLCFMNFTRKQITTITRSSNYSCSSSDLNYPSFMAFFKSTPSTSYEFQRTLTNVGDDIATYKAKVRVPIGTSVSVTPSTLVFGEKTEKLSFNLTVDIKHMEKLTAHGYLVWEQVRGNHTIRSSIVVVRKF